MKFTPDIALVLVVAIGCGTCAYNNHQMKSAIIECARLGRVWEQETCKETAK